ncbi:MAG: hypothetical protein U0Z26_18040 [Anaerolineales bacterium]
MATTEITVADLLKSTPLTAGFFIKLHTACVGCYLTRFCTLQDVVNTYQIDEEFFFEEIAKYTSPNLKMEPKK